MKELRDFSDSVTLLVSSCDAFFDAWRPFAFFLRKFWPDCPFAVRLITNHLEVRSSLIHALPVGSDRGWASNMRIALERIATPYLLYIQEDYFLTAAVDNAQLARDLSYALERGAASLCFYDLSGIGETALALPGDRLVEVPAESKGRTRLQATLWNREALLSVLRPGDSAWQMEAQGSERTRHLLMLAYARTETAPIRYLSSAIIRGLWTPEALALCHAHGLEIEPHFRRQLVQGKYRRRWQRALSRAGLLLAQARQRGNPVDLD
ncbi:MAG TPA: hypothetical protein VG095_04075 [Chthoniobacterales bacterium]|nr:hypothetical protein [Chthoniobacterales bacterium]